MSIIAVFDRPRKIDIKELFLTMPNEFYLCSGVCAKILYLCRRPRVNQETFVNALLNCFTPGRKYRADYINRFLKCEKNAPALATDVIDNERLDKIIEYFIKNVQPLLNDNNVRDIIQTFCKIIEKDATIKTETVINRIEGFTKPELPSIKIFHFVEFVVGIFIYTMENTVNVNGEQCSKTITEDYIKQISAKKRRFTWEWTRQGNGPNVINAYHTKAEVLDELLNLLEQNSKIDFLCVFGGVSSKLVGDDTCGLFSKWLSKNEKANLYLCYETGKAAKDRAMILDQKKIKPDGKPTEPSKRYKVKEEEIKDAINKFHENIRDRVHFIPITLKLNHHIVLIDNDVYWNTLNDGRSSDSSTFKPQRAPIGIKIIREHLEYINRILTKNKDNDSVISVGKLKKKINDLLMINRV